MPRESLTRRNLPHWFVPGAVHFVTFRLAGTLPLSVVAEMKKKEANLLSNRPEGTDLKLHRCTVNKILFGMYDRYLDNSWDIRRLADSRIAELVQKSLRHFDGERYYLHSYCIMPNHVHALIEPLDPGQPAGEMPIGEQPDSFSPLSKIMKSLKGYTARRANRILGRQGQFWQHESYDHWVRDLAEFERILEYIHLNPVKANLIDRPEDWIYSSCYGERHLS